MNAWCSQMFTATMAIGLGAWSAGRDFATARLQSARRPRAAGPEGTRWSALAGGARKFLIDFTNTGYIDSSGLGVLVSLSRKIREVDGDLRLAGLNEDLRTLFELTKLDTLFTIADTPAAALAGF